MKMRPWFAGTKVFGSWTYLLKWKIQLAHGFMFRTYVQCPPNLRCNVPFSCHESSSCHFPIFQHDRKRQCAMKTMAWNQLILLEKTKKDLVHNIHPENSIIDVNLNQYHDILFDRHALCHISRTCSYANARFSSSTKMWIHCDICWSLQGYHVSAFSFYVHPHLDERNTLRRSTHPSGQKAEKTDGQSSIPCARRGWACEPQDTRLDIVHAPPMWVHLPPVTGLTRPNSHRRPKFWQIWWSPNQ